MKHVMPGYEKRKVAIDFFKHIATLSVACTAVMISFLPQLQKLEKSEGLLIFAVFSFFTSVISTVLIVAITLTHIENLPEKHGTSLNNLHRLSSLVAILGFLCGVGGLCWLTIANLE